MIKKRDDKLVSGDTDIAIAVKYDGNNAPKVTAKGKKAIAETIIKTAGEANIPLYPDPELAVILSQVPIGDEIPEALYIAIAEVITFAYLIAGKFPEGFEQEKEARDSH